MNTINARLKLTEHQDVAVKGVTPAEAILLREVHAPAEAKFSKNAPPDEQANYWKMFTNPVPSGEATTPLDEEGKKRRARTDAEEVSRLRAKYPVRGKANQAGTHICDELFPGLSPRLPETFEEIGFHVEQRQVAPQKAHGPEMAVRSDDELRERAEKSEKTTRGKKAEAAE